MEGLDSFDFFEADAGPTTVEPVDIQPYQPKKRRLAHIEKVIRIMPISLKSTPTEEIFHEKLVIAEVLKWKVAVPKDTFKVDDLVIFIEIDSILPDTKEFQYLKETDSDGLHIKTEIIGNQTVQGHLIPISILELYPKMPEFKIAEGVEVTQILGITKYDPPQKEPKPNKQPKLALANGNLKEFPSFICQTDEERIQNLPKMFDPKYKDTLFYVTEKIDGTSCTFYYKDGDFGVCSRNFEVLDTTNELWKIADQYKLKEKLSSLGMNIAIQGELLGERIQKKSL